jgi:hypothetical protein
MRKGIFGSDGHRPAKKFDGLSRLDKSARAIIFIAKCHWRRRIQKRTRSLAVSSFHSRGATIVFRKAVDTMFQQLQKSPRQRGFDEGL